jgi:hypothetical protein
MTTETVSESSVAPNTERGLLPFLLWGAGLWVVAAVAVRLVGGFLLDPSAPVVLAALYVVTVPAMTALTLGIFRLHGVAGERRGRVVAALLLPVVVLDAGALLAFGTLFPNLSAGVARFFGAWVLVAYAGVLLAAFVPRE